MNPASNLILIGPTGAGKTSIGRRLAERLGLRFVDADAEIEARTGASIPLIFELEGEAGFRERESQALAALCRERGLVLATGGGAVLAEANRHLLREAGFVLYLRTGVGRQLQRLARDRSRPLLRTPDRRQRLEQMARERGPLYESMADFIWDSEHGGVGTAVDGLIAVLGQRWQRPEAEHAA